MMKAIPNAERLDADRAAIERWEGEGGRVLLAEEEQDFAELALVGGSCPNEACPPRRPLHAPDDGRGALANVEPASQP